jgi:membrane protein YqaA with SNARE-associated domain
MRPNTKTIIKFLVFLGVILVIGIVVHQLAQNEVVLSAIATLGYVGVILAGFLGGLNAFVPIPAATLSTLFLNAGLSIPLIIFSLAIGTLIADWIGYLIGYFGRHTLDTHHPRVTILFTDLHKRHNALVIPLVFIYAAFVPLPNELFLIPLALAKSRFTPLIIPLFLGNLINQALLVYGFSSIFSFFG